MRYAALAASTYIRSGLCRTKVPHASLRGQRGSKEDGTHLLDGVLQPCAQTVTHPPWIGMFPLSVFRIPPVLLSVQNGARRHHAALQIAPQGDQQLAGHRDDGDAPDATLAGPDTLSWNQILNGLSG